MNPAWPTVLHVEDDSGDRELLRHACEAAAIRFNTVWVQDGQAAIDYLAGKDDYAQREQYPVPSLVLLDLKLPRKTGFEVLNWIRAQPKLKWLPVVIFTASNHPGDIQRAFDAGVNSFLVKPAAYTDLIEIVKLLNRYWFQVGKLPQN